MQEAVSKVAGWLDLFFVDEASKLKDIVDHVHQLTVSETSHLPGPNEVSATMMCTLLDHILRLLVRMQPQLMQMVCRLRNGLYNHVFMADVESCEEFMEKANDSRESIVPNVPDIRMQMTQFMAQGYGLWAGRASILVEAHKNRGIPPIRRDPELDYWKQCYIKKVFIAWRATTRTERQIHRYQQQLADQAELIDSLQAKVAEQVTQSHELLEAQCDMQAQLANRRHEVDNKALRIEVARLEKEVERLSLELMDTENYVKQSSHMSSEALNLRTNAREHRRCYIALEQVIKDSANTLKSLVDPALNDLKIETDNLADEERPIESMLLEWVKLVLKRSPIWPEERSFLTWDLTSAELVQVILACASVIIPNQEIKHVELQSCFDSNSPEVHSATMSKVQRALGIPSLIMAKDVTAQRFLPRHAHVLVGLLFERFLQNNFEAVPNCPPAKLDDRQLSKLPEKEPQPERTWHKLYLAMKGTFAREKFACDVRKHVVASFVLSMHTTDLDELNIGKQQKEQYLRVDPNRLATLFSADPDTEVKLIESILDHHFKTVFQVYKFYAVSQTRNAAMTAGEFQKFCMQAGLSDKKVLHKNKILEVFSDSQSTSREGGADAGWHADLEMAPSEFVEGLVRIAHLKLKQVQEPDTEQLIGNQLEVLVKEMKAKCLTSEIDEFVQQMRKPQVVQVLTSHKKKLQDVFKRYTTPNGNQSKVHGPEMTFKDFQTLIADAKLMELGMSHHTVKQVFFRVQYEESGGQSNTLFFHEFCDAMIFLATFKYPAPYFPLHQRIEQFFIVSLFSPLQHHFNDWDGKALHEAARQYATADPK